jgi:ornithine cyclodeaminase/alanine dehydrogenase-like protein (mu-crystallin family)
LLIFGSGLQADWHARLVSTLSSKLETIIIASREVNTRSEELKHDLSEYFKPKGIEVKACSIAEAAEWGGPAHSADLICW